MKNLSVLTFLSVSLLTLSAQAQSSPSSDGNKIVLSHSLITAIHQVQVPGKEPGVLMELDPETSREGAEVKEGDVLGQIDDSDALAKKAGAEAELDVAKAEAESEAELNFAKASKEVSEAELQSFLDANRRSPGSISNSEIRRAQLQVKRAGFEIELRQVARENAARTIKVKEAQLKGVDNELDRRKITAPLDGVVVKRNKHVGEWVQPGETILEIVRLDRLRVEGFVPASQYSRLEVAGAPVTVSVRVPTREGGTETITAKGAIEYVSPIVEASGGYRVWTEIENKKMRGDDGQEYWMFNPGTIATMEISLQRGVKRPDTRPVSTVRDGR